MMCVSCVQAIAEDMMKKTSPMDRLICGDVGFGKTEVAMRAIYRAVLAGRQVAFMAPTRVLCNQHLRNLVERMPDVSIRQLKGADKEAKAIKAGLKTGEIQVVVGTSALVQKSVQFSNLGLVVIDEEQKFGVAQKEYLRSSGVDVLSLSATPIPRTLQMSMDGLKDVTQLNSPPSGRKPVIVDIGRWDNTSVVEALTREV
jgi:transcription-repair coupling factor (superfamily II helicase)